MVRTSPSIAEALDALARQNPAIARAIEQVGYPQPRVRAPGYRTLLRTIVGQQLSVAAAATIWSRLESLLGPELDPGALLAADADSLRACGLSRQKQDYLQSLCEQVANGTLDLAALPDDDEAAIEKLTRIRGVGRWSAEIYLLFAEGRQDIWPAGDLAVQEGVRRLLDLPERPREKQARALAEPWRPHRGAMAIFTWHYYANPAL